MQRVNDIREQIARKFLNHDFVGNTVEIIGATFLADEPAIFGEINHEWNQREVQWYREISLNINDIKGNVPAIWRQVATPDGEITSNYGWAIWSEENGNQYKRVLEKLKSDPNSRQAQHIYTRPTMHTEWCENGKKDFICTMGNSFYIRDNKLVSHYIMRSNDLAIGYKGDVFWCAEVQKQLAKDLGIGCGPIIWTASSAHIYSRHYYLIDNYIKTDGREIAISKADYIKLYPDSVYV